MKNRKVHNSNAHIPGCLGRMVNLFDINPGMVVNKRIMDKSHFDDGSSRPRSRSDVTSSLSSIEDLLEDKLIISELQGNGLDRTPMKVLIDHEMSKEEEPKLNPPSLVAKLMGLDTLPRRNNDSVPHHSRVKSHVTNTEVYSEKPQGYKHTDKSVSDKQSKYEADFQKQKEYRDINEIRKQAQGDTLARNLSLQKSRHVKNIDETKMALVRQKFVEAKRLVTDEKLRQTKAFQDALEFLSSNRDLFLECLQEPSSHFSQQAYGNYTIPVTPETQRITVLKPFMTQEDGKASVLENKSRKQAKKLVPVAQAHGRSKSSDESSTFSHWDAGDSLPTRIVVLKPSIDNARAVETIESPISSTFKTVQGKDVSIGAEVYNHNESRVVAKEITRQMRDRLMGQQSDETLDSSVFSNGYTGDESSMNKSDNDYDGESDSEVMSPTSRHSWDYINRFSSPFSTSSFSRASCSPESSVCREAKKRLSERWAMVALHGNPPENRHVRRSSFTLGEMLALSDTKKSQISEEVGCKETLKSTPLAEADRLLDPSRPFTRSKSVPVSSSVYSDRLKLELSGPAVSKREESTDAKPKSTKVSFIGKVSSFVFPKNKKVKKAISNVSEAENLPHVNTPSTPELFIGKHSCQTSMLIGKEVSKECRRLGVQGKTIDIASSEGQPSPISVLETPFGENNTLEFTSCSEQDKGRALGHQLKSCLIDKSPPIGSISRTISWKDSCLDTPTTDTNAPSVALLESESEEDWFNFVQTVLADSGFCDEVQSEELPTRWHLPDSPLDPLLREKYINQNNKAFSNEAKRRQWRSSCKLMYDCVNAALVDIARTRIQESKHRLLLDTGDLLSEGHNQVTLTGDVWTRIKEWINYDARSLVGVDDDSKNRLLVESVLKNEVVGKRWVENVRVEIDEVGKEIEERLLDELVDDAVVAALTDRDL